jgi:hypothetical protein
MTTLTPNERVTMRDFVRLKNIDRVAESEGITRTAVKHRLGRVYEKLRDAGNIGDGSPCMEIVEYVIRAEKALRAVRGEE